jgi:phosphoribosylamine---glycine ligase
MTKTILVVGSGGREHALADRLRMSPGVGRVLVCPGNAGTDSKGLSGVAGDPLAVARHERPDLVVVGPDAQVCAGLVDELQDAGWLAYGPSKQAAQLEGSKAFMKAFAERWGIRSARHVEVRSVAQLEAGLAAFTEPPVVKASGLCAGKGVVVAESFEEARLAARAMLSGEAFGEAGLCVVLEERLYGQEASVHAICDGEQAMLLPAIQDHKRIFEGDQGPNTGGMGTYGPARVVTAALEQQIRVQMVERILEGMRAEGTPFKGTLFLGLMISDAGEPVLLEINVRFGDPETQVLMNLLEGDFAGLLESAARGALKPELVSLAPLYGLCVVLAAQGYPGAPKQGDEIHGLEAAEARPGVKIYHAGTRRDAAGRLLTAGGRVLGVVATAADLQKARDAAYAACEQVTFSGKQLRQDIGYRQLSEQSSNG